MAQSTNVTEFIKTKGRYLGALIVTSRMPSEQKKHWLEIIPHMSLEHIDRLFRVLEVDFANQSLSQLDDDFKRELQTIHSDYENKLRELDEEAKKKLKELVHE